MKKYRTVDMQPGQKVKLIGNLLGSFGNENIRAGHIKYFEDKILEYKETREKDITSTPNYYAWLCLMAEHIFWIMRKFCFKQSELEEDNLILMYNRLVTKFCDICRNLGIYSESKIEDLHRNIVKVLEIRHAIVHKGFPNLLPVVFEGKHTRNKPAITSEGGQEKFSESATKQTIGWYSNPMNFDVIKAEFESIRKAMSKGPGISVGF